MNQSRLIELCWLWDDIIHTCARTRAFGPCHSPQSAIHNKPPNQLFKMCDGVRGRGRERGSWHTQIRSKAEAPAGAEAGLSALPLVLFHLLGSPSY